MIVGFENYKNKYTFEVTGILHIGAHFGQEYDEYIKNFGNIETHWFEPIPDVYQKLKGNLGEKPNTHLYNIALGDIESTEEIYVDEGNEGQSSSILKPKDHVLQFPHILFKNENKVEVKVCKLDDFKIDTCNMMVLDTQGYELKVLRGSIKTLEKIKYLFTEFNTIEMYEGCPTLDDLDEFLYENNFTRIETWYTSGNWGDAFYIKTIN